MKRRDFIKGGICLGCAGAIGAGIPLFERFHTPKKLPLEKFMCKSVEDLPGKIRLDLCSLCQLHCVKCYIRCHEDIIKKEGPGFGYVSFETFKNFVDNNSYIKEIETSNHGELFLNPDLEDIIKYSYEKGIKLTAYTGVNLNSLSEQMAEALVKYKFKALVVSIDGATPETYSIYRRGGNFDTVINNIKLINKYKRKYNSIYPLMVYKFILFGHNIHEIRKAKLLARKLNMYMLFAPNYAKDYSPVPPEKIKKVIRTTGVNPLYHDSEILLKNYKITRNANFFCKELYENPQFAYNGDMFGCLKPYLKAFDGNLFKDGLLKSLNDEKVLYAKQMLADFSTEPRKDIICSNCYVYKYIKENNFPIKYEKTVL